MKDFFISYNKADRKWAEWIAWTLEEAGNSTILQAWDFRPGCNFLLEMDKATKDAERTILVLSQDFLNSSFTAPEWAAAFVQDPKGDKGKLLPIKIRDCRPEGLLASIDRIDLIGLNEEEARNELLEGVSLERAKPKAQPAFPGIRSMPDRPRFPGELPKRGALPPGHRVPFLPNAIFTGRQEQLKEIGNILLDTSKECIGVAITGIGGVGKSQLAVELCYRYGRFLKGVHWIQANLDMSAEVAECGRAMGMSNWPDKLPEQVAATLRAWQQGDMRLIVLDNAEDLKLLNEWMPKLQPCRLLITSKREKYPADIGLVAKRLDEFARSQSIELLRKLAPRLRKVPDEDLDALAKYLGDLPLALDLAGRYLEERTELSIQEYLKELEEAGNVLEHTSLKGWVEHNPTNHSTSLAATFVLSWDQLGEADELAKLLFKTGGYCAPNMPISRQLLAKATGAKESDQELDRALRKLESLGLMQLTESGHRIHTMLAEFARLQDSNEKKSTFPALADAMIKITNQALESGLPEKMRSLQGHIKIIAQRAEKADVMRGGALWSNYGIYLSDLADFDDAVTSLKKALLIDQEIYGPDNPAVARDFSNLGIVLLKMGKLQEARECCERSCNINKKNLPEWHPRHASDANNLGGVLKDLGQLQDARKCFENALRINKMIFDPDHPDIARSLNNLGTVLQDLGELQDAKELYERALIIDEKHYGPDHPAVAVDFNNLGAVLVAQGEIQTAKHYFEKALQIDEKIYGLDHLVVATITNNLGRALKDLGEMQDARNYFERALRILRQKLGEDHPNTKIVKRYLELLDS